MLKQSMLCRIVAASLVLAAAVSVNAQTGAYALRNGDRVAWYGDSITDNSAYCIDAEAYTVLHFPKLAVRYFNAGVGGDRVYGGWMGDGDQRLTRDLFSRKPTVITIMLGMNDASYMAFDQPSYDAYKKGYQHIADRIHAEDPNARVWLFRPSPYDEIAHTTHPDWMKVDSYNNVLLRFADYVSELATANHYGIVDQNAPLNELLTKAKAINPELAAKIIPDAIHPGWQGDLIMAEDVLKAWNAPSVVSDVSIDAVGAKATAHNASVKDLHTGDTTTWTETDESLPFPINRKDPLAALVLQSSDFDQALNQENLHITGLQAGSYHLKIDGKDIGTFTADQLSSGLNLAQLDTPMIEQANKVMDLTNKRGELWYQRWRQLDFTLQDYPSPRLEAAKRGLDGEIEDLVSLQHQAAMPKPHKYEVLKS